MRRDVQECRLRDAEGGMPTLGFLLRLALLAILLGAVYAAVTLLPQILEIADGDPLTWEGHL